MSNNQTPQHGSPGTELEAIEQDMAEVEKLETPNKSDEPVESIIENASFEQ